MTNTQIEERSPEEDEYQIASEMERVRLTLPEQGAEPPRPRHFCLLSLSMQVSPSSAGVTNRGTGLYQGSFLGGFVDDFAFFLLLFFYMFFSFQLIDTKASPILVFRQLELFVVFFL